jgi:hypothetical protein
VFFSRRDAPLAVIHVPDAGASGGGASGGGGGGGGGSTAAEWARRSADVHAIAPGWLFGSFEAIEAAVRANVSGGGGGGSGGGATDAAAAIVINVVWGCGTWGFTQVRKRLLNSPSPFRLKTIICQDRLGTSLRNTDRMEGVFSHFLTFSAVFSHVSFI